MSRLINQNSEAWWSFCAKVVNGSYLAETATKVRKNKTKLFFVDTNYSGSWTVNLTQQLKW